VKGVDQAYPCFMSDHLWPGLSPGLVTATRWTPTDETKQNKTKQNKTKQNKTKRNETKRNFAEKESVKNIVYPV
jgi:hypothetical protein